jgi:hypothetical protein
LGTSFYPAADTAIFQLQSRFEEQHLASKMFNFLFPKYLLQLSDEDLGEAAHKVHDAYSTDINSDIVSEVRSFRRQFKEEIEGSNSILDLLILMINSGIMSFGAGAGNCMRSICYITSHRGKCRTFFFSKLKII